MTDCLFCKLRDGGIPAQITYRDDDTIAFQDIKPVAPMHELVIPTRHISTLTVANEADAAVLGKLMLVGARRARENGYTDGGYRVVMNTGSDAGQTVFHVHLHVLAGRRLTWPPG
jgi:histidine triad (HIT) family protein